jgi:hypothetical protein
MVSYCKNKYYILIKDFGTKQIASDFLKKAKDDKPITAVKTAQKNSV